MTQSKPHFTLLKYLGMNLLWFLMTFPIFIVLITFDYVQNLGEVLTNLLLLIPLIAFLLFPASTALLGVIKLEREAREKVDVFLSYFSQLKKHYWASLKGGLIFSVALTAVFYGLYYFTLQRQLILSFIAFALFLILALLALYFIVLTTIYKASVRAKVTASFKLISGHKKHSIIFISVVTVISLLSATFLRILIPTFYGSLIGFVTYYLTKDRVNNLSN
ncbi:hypothetical protein GCM10008932_16800 [Alkalibacterium iburiense]|uniref:DUF624 domain-containing protein n=1 Tax=Alkalibacterium iburiense TaxID=290589 RepID=A0ABP3HB38_9LACT